MNQSGNGMNACRADIAVIGAGASGLTAAVAAARGGASVVLLERTPVSGKKILSTGNGRCNFTNELQRPDCYRSDDADRITAALARFSWRDSVNFFAELGVPTTVRDGYCYPRSGQASAIRDALLGELRRLAVHTVFRADIQSIRREDVGFCILTGAGEVTARRCILATGGMAAPKTGSNGSGYALARGLGHTVNRPLPALVPLVSSEEWLSVTAGVRCAGRVSLSVDGETEAEDTGEIQFTEYGVSGIPVFQVSRFASAALADERRVEVRIDFLPELSAEDVRGMLSKQVSDCGSVKNWQQILGGLCHKKIAQMIAQRLRLSDDPVGRLPEYAVRKQSEKILHLLKNTALCITGTRSFDQAQTTCGGVPLSQIGEDMQSKITPGLYFAGEILNVDGICGGYNLQWAWTSGYLAGTCAAAALREA
ncbi:MAG: NAD(P)/FAD-dependent oxidoreductase [Clostridiales bacterium]|nr:NAD(P)/FAD-dependent oxidoreductase [Clostridiales bacterium]